MTGAGFTAYKGIVGFCVIAGVLFASRTAVAQESGKDIFQAKCAACHTVGGGRLVGPDLKGVAAKRDPAWLKRWIREPDKMVDEGDPIATQLLKEFNNLPMPPLGLSEADVEAVISHIQSTEGTPAASQPADASFVPTPDEIKLGQNLFQGRVRFANGGPSCIACHSAHYGDTISGGILAKELTTSFSRLGATGIRSILTNPPFPVMKSAFEGRPFGDDEIRAMIGFLQHVDRENTLHQPREYGWALFGAGLGGVAVLMGFYSAAARRRKKQSVNQAIYDRQIKSE